jgi:hypothetical protein
MTHPRAILRLLDRPAVRARWPLALLVLVPLVILLAPLAADGFIAIPWPIRKTMGRAVFLSLLALGFARLVRVRPRDRWPQMTHDVALSADARWAARWLPWVLQGAVASLAWPLLSAPDNLGFGDWDHHLQKFEAIRRSVLDWHQFPWWTPWCRGGFPLASEPECGVVSLATPFVLIFGTATGLRLATIGCLMIAVEGARRVAWLWLREPWAAAAAGLIYGINGAVLVYTVAGHFIPMSYCATPWMIYYAFRIGHRLADGIWLGFWTAFDVLNGIQYPSVYGVVIATLVGVRALRVEQGPRRGRLLVHTLAALGVFLALAGWRIATTVLVLRDYPREWYSLFAFTPREIFTWLFTAPGPETLKSATQSIFWETQCYVGALVVFLALASLRQGWRWWHTLTLLCFWFAIGSVNCEHPSYWLSQAPVFRTMHVVTRWRIPAMLGLGLAAAATVAHWRTGPSRLLRRLAIAMVVLIAIDLLSYGHHILPVACSVEPATGLFPGPATEEVVNVEYGLGFPCIARGYGVIRAHEPLLGYDRGLPTARLWKGHPDYRGEAWTEDGTLIPESWSPHRIVYIARPGEIIHINQNPGSWWLINGDLPFAAERCAEWTKPFVARADARGRLELRIAPRGLRFGLALHVAGIVLLAASVAWWLRQHSGTQKPNQNLVSS